jgi:hypothetical protein
MSLPTTRGQEAANRPVPSKENFHLFLLAGQSNMAGRGDVEAADKTAHARVLALTKEGTWATAVDPIHYDKPMAGVGLGKTFAEVLANRDTNIVVGLIPAACGGSPISAWQPGAYFDQTTSHPYDDAIRRAKLAMQTGTLKAILWHQGESDSDARLAPAYREKLVELIARFRKDLGDPNLPVIIGQLGQFEGAPWTGHTRLVNTAQIEVARETPNVKFVSSERLTAKADNLHFDAPALREFGRRYASAYLELTQPGKR